MTHEQMMEKSWNFIHIMGITEDKEKFEKGQADYFVENIYSVRDAYYKDLEEGCTFSNEDIETFFYRHKIDYKA